MNGNQMESWIIYIVVVIVRYLVQCIMKLDYTTSEARLKYHVGKKILSYSKAVALGPPGCFNYHVTAFVKFSAHEDIVDDIASLFFAS